MKKSIKNRYKKYRVIVLASNEFRQLEILYGENPQSPFLYESEVKIKMATTSLWKVESRIDHVVDYATDKDKTKNKYYNQFNNFSSVRDLLSYATNPDKTEKQFFTTGINCKVEDAVKQMELVKTLYGKEDGILAFHGYQSFNKGEVTPEIAHEIGVRLAEEMWGDRFQVVVSTHLNTEHIHNHFVVNSVSFKDGLKYYSNLANTALLRKTSDDLCDEYGLRVLEEKTCKSGINFENFYKKSIRDSDYYKFAKEDLDYAIKHSYTQKEFHQYLSSMGYSYYYRANKLCIRREPYKRNIRVERAFGEEYSVESIRQKIIANDFIPKQKIIPYKRTTLKFYGRKSIFRKAYKAKGIIALYYYYRFLLGLYPKHNMQYKLTPKMREEVKKMDEYSERIRFLCKYKLETVDNVDELKSKKLREKQDILNARNRLYYKRGKVDNETEKNEITKQIIAVTTELKRVKKEIRMCDEVTDNVPSMKEQIQQMEEKEQDKVQKKKTRKHEL